MLRFAELLVPQDGWERKQSEVHSFVIDFVLCHLRCHVHCEDGELESGVGGEEALCGIDAYSRIVPLRSRLVIAVRILLLVAHEALTLRLRFNHDDQIVAAFQAKGGHPCFPPILKF